MTLDALTAELDRWSALGKRATLWWRDDDASDDTPALRRLLAQAESHDAPLALAVIPARLDARAVHVIAASNPCTIVQHGIAHRNHAPAAEKRSELGTHRSLDVVGDELRRSRDALAGRFGPKFMAVLVPPWNRIAASVVAALPAWGYRGVSTFGPRAVRTPLVGLVQCNTHVDLIAWRNDRSFVGEQKAVAGLAAHLTARRESRVDPDEPTGLLTHHLDFDDAAWEFIDRLLACTTRHPAAQWISPAEAFPAEDAGATSARSA